MNILVLSKYNRDGASSRYRFYNYRFYFEKNSINYVFKPLLDEKYVKNLYEKKNVKVFFQKITSIFKRLFFLIFFTSKYDLIVIEKELFPNIPFIFEKILLRGKKYVLDFDDYIATDYKLNNFKKIFLKNKIDKLSKGAKFVTVGNHWYFDEIKSDNLIYLPTVIDLDCYSKIKKIHKKDITTIVWIGSLSTGKYLNLIIPVLQDLSKKYSIKIKIIGADITINDVNLDLVKWNESTEINELLSSDIGIMPLNNTLWEKGKCGFKLIQYMACAIPVVASPAPANEEIIENGVNGYIAHNEKEWYKYLEKLIIDPSLRENFGKSGRSKILSSYSYQVWGDKYCGYLKSEYK